MTASSTPSSESPAQGNPGPASPIMTPAAMRSLYVTLTDRLIHRVESAPDPTRVQLLFLDKSGRPVAWLLKALWPVLARVPETSFNERCVPPLPPLRFANIDREQWWDQTGASETGVINTGLVPTEQIAQLRALFTRHQPHSGEQPLTRPPSPGVETDDIFATPAYLDDAHIIVIDEVRASGDTLTIASGLVARAFPTSTIEAAHWIAPEVRRSASSGVAQQIHNPVWYRHDSAKGRLVGDRQAPDHRGSHWRGRLAPLFTSTVPATRDLTGLQLRREIDALASAVTSGQLLARPGANRPEGDVDERIACLYGYTDLRAFTAARAAQADLR